YGDTNFTTRVGHSWAWTGSARHASIRTLKSHIASPFEFEHLARVVGRSHREAELFQNAAHLRHLLGIGRGELAAADPQAVLQPDADVAAHHRRLRGNLHLRAPRAEHRPVVRVAEQAIGGALHVDHVLGMVADAAADAEHRLDEKRRL